MPNRDKRLDPFNHGIDPPDPEWLDPPRPCGHEWRNNDFTCMDCVEARIAKLQQELDAARSASRPCTWLWTPEDNSGFWTAQCKEDWPISLLHEGAKFCAFCGGELIVESEAFARR